MNKIYAEERQRTLRLRKQVKKLIYNELKTNMNPHWFISFHYTENKTNEDEVLKDVADLKNKIRRIAYKNRDRSIKDAGSFPYPKMLFFNEQSHLGTGQYHTHMIMEKMPATINTQADIDNLFRKILPFKIKSLSKWKSVDIQRISCEDEDLRSLSSYLGKDSDIHSVALDGLNSDLQTTMKKQITQKFTIELPEAEAIMLDALQKRDKELRDLRLFLIELIRKRYGIKR